MANENQLNLKQLVDGLNGYLINGYIEALSFEEPEQEAFDYLIMLKDISRKEGLRYCKLILESDTKDNDFLRSICLLSLLLSETDWEYAFSFLLENSRKLSILELKEACSYFYCAKNETDPHPVPEGLFRKLMDRYQELKNEHYADVFHLHEEYNNFIKVHPLDN